MKRALKILSVFLSDLVDESADAIFDVFEGPEQFQEWLLEIARERWKETNGARPECVERLGKAT